jgi:hypothetical protein
MEKNESKSTEKITGIVTALGKFQQSVPAISKSSEAGQGNFKYKYGSLPHIIEAIKPHLKAADLCFTQPINTREGVEYIYTILYHTKTGEKVESKIALPQVEFKGMNVVQSKGAIITYLRRYALMSILGLVTDDDDNDAQGETAPKQKAQTSNKAAELPWLNPSPPEKWNAALKYLADGGKIADIKKKYRIGKNNEEKLLNEAMSFDDLPFDRASVEDAEILSTDPDNEPNLDFENQ